MILHPYFAAPRNYTLRQLSLNYCGIGEDGETSTSGCLMPMTDPWELIDFTYIYHKKNPPFMLGKQNVFSPMGIRHGSRVSNESRRCVTLGMTRVEE